MFTIEEKAYVAGIIDGEGSIMLTRFHNNQFPAPCIAIASTSLELLQWVKDNVVLAQLSQRKTIIQKTTKTHLHIL